MTKQAIQADNGFLSRLNSTSNVNGGLQKQLSNTPTPSTPSKAFDLPLDLVDEDPNQPRTEFAEDEHFMDMVSSITLRGVKTPISVRVNPDKPGNYLINHGAQRFRASLKAGKTTIPAHIDNDYTELDQLVENVQRKDLSPHEIGAFLYRMTTKAGRSQSEVAKLIGKPQQYISRHLAFVNAPEELVPVLREHVRDAKVAAELRKLHLLKRDAVMAWLQNYGIRHDDQGKPLPLSMPMMADLRSYLAREEDELRNTPSPDRERFEVRQQAVAKRLQTMGRHRSVEDEPSNEDQHGSVSPSEEYPEDSDSTDNNCAANPPQESTKVEESSPSPPSNNEERLADTWFALEAGLRVNIIVEHCKHRAMVDLRRKPSKPHRIFLQYLDDRTAVEVDQKNIRVLSIGVA